MNRRHPWRVALVVWAVLLVVAGGLTLWLQDSADPRGPYGWERASPTPSACADATPDEEGRTLCLVRITR